MLNLENKKILLILPKYFGYEKFIINRLRKSNAEVFFIYENVDNIRYSYRFVNAYLPKIMPGITDKYFYNRIKKLPQNLDYVLVVRGQFLSNHIMSYMRKKFLKKCKFVMYQWDSIKNNANAVEISKFFDKIFTFDKIDAKTYKWNYRPLFYIEDLVNNDNNKTIDILYICSLHSRRVTILNILKEFCKEQGLVLYSHMYSKLIVFYKRKYISRRKEYLAANNKDVCFNSLSLNDTYKLYNKSKIVFDYTHPGQKGLTIRTIECLGNGCKLITNNELVKYADFYNSNNIYIYKEDNIKIPDKFINTPYNRPQKDIFEKYSLKSWLEEILGW